MGCNNNCGCGIFGGNSCDWVWIIIAIIVISCLCNDNRGGNLFGDCCN